MFMVILVNLGIAILYPVKAFGSLSNTRLHILASETMRNQAPHIADEGHK